MTSDLDGEVVYGGFDQATLDRLYSPSSCVSDIQAYLQHAGLKRIGRDIFKQDVQLDRINLNIHKITAEYIRAHPEHTEHALHILSMIRKLERVGDHSKNIAEELIFYIEAKVLKHSRKKKYE